MLLVEVKDIFIDQCYRKIDSSTNAKIIIARYFCQSKYATAGTLGVNINLYPFAFQEVGWIGIFLQYLGY